MANKIEHATVRNELSANNAFIGAELKLDEAIRELQAIRERHFGFGDEQRNWAEAETAASLVNEVVAAINRMNGHSEG